MYPQYHPYLIAAAVPADSISPQTMRYIGYAILICAVLYWLNRLFGNASN